MHQLQGDRRRDRQHQHHDGGHVGLLAEHAVEDVTAVQLADGHQVDRSDQQAHPTGEGDRVIGDDTACGIGPCINEAMYLHQQRAAQTTMFSWLDRCRYWLQ